MTLQSVWRSKEYSSLPLGAKPVYSAHNSIRGNARTSDKGQRTKSPT